MPIGLNDTDIEVDYGGGNIFNVDIPKYLVTTTTEVSEEEIPIVNKDILTRTLYNNGSDVTNGLVAHYKFDGDLTDSSGNGNDITIVSGTIDYHFNYKVNGQSSLIGANEYIEITSLNVLTAIWSGEFTISFWLYPTTSDKEYLVGGWDDAPSGGLRGGWYITARNGNLEWTGLTGGNFPTIIDTNNNIVANTWNHISISNTGTTFNISLNGMLKTLTTSDTLDTPHTNLGDRHIGIGRAKRWSGSGYDYDNNGGYYDDFRVYDRALTTTEISNLYNLGAVNIEEGDISGTNDKYVAYKYTAVNDNGSGQSEYNLNFNNPALCDILVVAGGGAGGGNGQAGGGGAGALIYYEDVILHGDYIIKVGNGGTNGNTANVGDSGSDSEFYRTSDNKQQFLAKGGGGGGTWNNSGYKPLNGGSGGGGAGDSTSGKLVAGNILNDIPINIVTGSATLVDYYNITMFPGDKGVDSLNDIGCFGNYGGIEMSGGHDDWGAGGGGAGTKGVPTSESSGIQKAGNGGSGKKYNITGTEVYYAAGGGGGIRPGTSSLSIAQVGTGGLGGGGAGGGGGDGTSNSALDSSGVDADPHTGSGGGGVGAVSTANYKGGDGGSGIIIVRYKNENISNDAYIPQGDNATEYTILDSDSTNLVAHYKFDEGAEYRDSVYGYYDLIDLDNTSLFNSTEKVFGKSAHESGTEEAKIQFPDSIASQISEISSTTGITFSFWFNMNTNSGPRASLFEFSDTASDTTSTNRIGIARNDTDDSIWIGIKEDNSYTEFTCGVVDNEWHHITWSIDNKGSWQVYFDGVNQYPNKYKQIPQINNYDYSYLFGSVQSTQTNGYIDDFRIYNKVLNSLEINYLANKSIKFAPKEIDSEYNLLTFLYHDSLADDDELVYDFGAQSITNYATFAAYAYTIPGITGVETFNTWNSSNGGGVGAYDGTQGNPQVHGTIKIPLPTEYNHVKVEYAQVYGSANATINLYVATYTNLMTSVVKSSITNYNARTFEYSYSNNDYLMIEVPIGSEGILGDKLRITFSKKQSSYNLTFDNPTECDFLILGGGGGTGGYDNHFGGGGAGGLVFEQTVTLSSAIIKVGDGGKSNSNGVSSTVSYSSGITRTAFGGGGGVRNNLYSRAPYNGNDGGSGGGGSGLDGTHPGGISYHASNAPDGLGYGNNGGQGSGTVGQANNAGGGGGGAGTAGTNGSNANAGDGGDGLSGIGDIDFKTHFALSTNNYIGEYIADEDKVYFAGGGGGGLHSSYITGSGHFGNGGKGGGAGYLSDDGNTEVTRPGLPNSGGGGTGTSDIGKGGSGVILVRYKRNMGTPTITTTTELAQWKYSATNANVVHKGNVGIGTFPLTNYNLNVKGDINTNNLYKNGNLIGTGQIKELEYTFPYFTSTPNVSSTYISGTSYKYITFVYDPDNDNGSNQTEYSFNVISDMQCDIMIVGGGGASGAGSGSHEPGGGGAGGVVYMVDKTINGKYKIFVGKGGINSDGYSSKITGFDDIAISIDSISLEGLGGGKGATYSGTGGNGGSAGGGSHASNGGSAQQGNTFWDSTQYVAGGHNSGGKDPYGGSSNDGGGGGGAGGAGNKDNGGIGRLVSITGKDVYYGGGGGASGGHGGGTGGLGGGGNGRGGGSEPGGLGAGHPGEDHTGGGGGAPYGPASSTAASQDGGSGVVIIRYLDTSYINEPTITNNADSDILFSDYNTIMLTYDSTNDNGNNQTNYTLNVTSDMSCEVLIVAGGGGGGMDMGGGGGGGGVIHFETLNLKAGAKTISVGNGGDYAPAAGVDGQPSSHHYTINAKQGANSVFDTYIAIGGGYGGSSPHTYTLGGGGGPGGSGGGSSGYSATNQLVKAGIGTLGQGNRGAYGLKAHYSGGGGGAGEIGGGGEDGEAARQRGGDGLQFDILGTPYYWGGGGGGSGYSTTGGNGGKGGGGGGAVNTTFGGTGGINDGQPGGGGVINSQTNRPGGHAGEHTGGGGGGGSHYQGNNRGGNGGSGVVIIKYSSLYELTTTNNIDYTLSLIDANKTSDDVYNIISFKHIDNIISDMHPTFSQDAVHLIAHYKFDGNYEDSNPQSTKYHLTNVDAELVEDGNIKSVLIDSDADELYTTDNMPAITSTSTYSWCCWVKRNRIGYYDYVFSQGVSSSTTEIAFHFKTDNDIRYYIYGYDLDATLPFIDTAVKSSYNHYVFTISNNTTKIYINGILRGSRSVSANIAANKLYIGKRGTTYSRINVADFRVYDKELSDSEVLELYTLYNGQTQYSVTFPEDTECDILVVGGGGGGGVFGGGGGGGGVLFAEKLKLSGNNIIKVGKGGIGESGIGTANGENGKPSLIEINGIEYTAIGGGGGGTRILENNWESSGINRWVGLGGSDGGSSGGGAQADVATDRNVGGDSIIEQYPGWNSYGNIGGSGADATSGSTNTWKAAGGGGGAGGIGSSIIISEEYSVGHGGKGKSFVEYFGTNVGDNGYFAGGGGGGSYGYTAFGNGGVELYGGGGKGNYTAYNPGTGETTTSTNATSGISNTGGGGGGTLIETNGGNGGSGIVIIRYKATLSNPITYRLKEWNYNTLNANTKFMGKVGIGTNNPSCALEVAGTITKNTLSFKIQHPLNNNKWLQHGSLEGPRYDNIYRGKKIISNGYGEIDIDTDCNTSGGMATGTFAALNGNPFLYLRNNQTYDRVIGEIDNGIIKVNCENTIDNIEVEWMVIGERKDDAVKSLQITDDRGRLRCERQL